MSPADAKRFVHRLDAISRTRQLRDDETDVLEQAIRILDTAEAERLRWGKRRELARSGIKRKGSLIARGSELR